MSKEKIENKDSQKTKLKKTAKSSYSKKKK